jgi:hypothetical protein
MYGMHGRVINNSGGYEIMNPLILKYLGLNNHKV